MRKVQSALPVPILLLALWQAAISLHLVSPILLPPPVAVIVSLKDLMLGNGTLWNDIYLTMFRMLSALVISTVCGVPVGLFMGSSKTVYSTFVLPVDFFRSIPPTALFPLFILFFGLGETSKIAVSVYMCSLVIIINSMYGVINAPHIRPLMGKLFGMSKAQIFVWITLPGALPQILSGIRISMSLSLVLTIVVEMFIGGNGGLGKRIYDFQLIFDSASMFAVIIVVGTLGYTLNVIVALIERRVAHWADK